MDKQPKVLCCQCVVCGGGCIIVCNSEEDARTRAENTKLFSIFVRCVSSSSSGEIDSSIISELDPAATNYYDYGLVFCSTCKSALIEWDKLYEVLHVIIPQNLSRIKFMFYAKILNNSAPDKIDTHIRKKIGDEDEVNDGRQSLLFIRKIQRFKDQICKKFSPRVMLKRISDGNDSRAGSKNLINGFDEDEFKALNEIYNEDDGDFIEDSQTKEDCFSVDDEPNDGAEQALPKASRLSVTAYWTLENDKILLFPVKVDVDQCPETPTAVFKIENNLEEIDAISSPTEDPSFVNNFEESADKFSAKILPHRSLRCPTERRPAAHAVGLADGGDDMSSDQEQGSTNAEQHNDLEIASEGSAVNGNDMEIKSVDSGDDGERVQKRSSLKSTKAGKRTRKFRTFHEVSPNEFMYNDKYSFRLDPNQELYLCSLCDYTSSAAMGVLGHIRANHYTDAEKKQHRAVEVAPGEYLYGGKYKILLENGRFRCALCNRTHQRLHALYPHFRVVHPDGSGEAAGRSQKLSVPRREICIAAQKPNARDANKATVHITHAKKEPVRQIEERTSLRRLILKGWKIKGNGKWVYKNNWQVVEQNGKFKCLACDMQEGDRRTTFNHVHGVHAKEPNVVKPAVPDRRDEVTELEYEGVPYKHDPIEGKYACSLCQENDADRWRMIRHIKDKHIDLPKFICDICGQKCGSRLSFRLHRARHEAPKYACKHCDKRFTAERYLRTHLKIHMGEDAKKHQCEFCGKKFYALKQLKNHRSIHTGEKPFPCDLCGESFPTTSKRREHRKKFHGGLPQKQGWKPTGGNVV